MATYILKEELMLWAKNHGKEMTAKSGALYYGFDFKSRERERCLAILVNHLKELGAEKGAFKGGPTKNTIVEFCLRPKHTYATNAKYNMAFICVEKELERVVLDVYGSESEYSKKHGVTRVSCEVSKSEAELKYETWYASEMKNYEMAIKDRAANPALDVKVEPPVPPKKWEDVKKELIASGQLIEEESTYQVDADVFASLGIKL